VGIFDKIKDAIWGKDTAGTAPSPTANPQKPVVTASLAPGATPKPAPTVPVDPAATAPTVPSPGVTEKLVDVAAMLDDAVTRKGQKLDWRRSIVDLMKALDLDSSLDNRKALAKELNYEGDTTKSAAMNVWLHKALMKKLAETGGRVPPELMD
jgi:hypothetical protein